MTRQKFGGLRALFLGIFVVVALGGILLWNRGDRASGGLQKAPDFQLQDRAGNSHRLSSYVGQVVILHFWASWCPPCIDELPAVLEFAKRYEKEEVKFVWIALEENWIDADRILKDLKGMDQVKGIVSLIDPTSSSSTAYGSYQFPETYLLDRKGYIVEKWVGPQKWEHEYFQKKMEAAINQR